MGRSLCIKNAHNYWWSYYLLLFSPFCVFCNFERRKMNNNMSRENCVSGARTWEMCMGRSLRRSTRTNTRSVPDRRITSPVTMLPTASAPSALRCRSNYGGGALRSRGVCRGMSCCCCCCCCTCLSRAIAWGELQQGGGAALPCMAMATGWAPGSIPPHCPLHTRESVGCKLGQAA